MRSQILCIAPGDAMIASNLPPQLQALALSSDDVEAYTGLPVTPFLIGNMLNGVYRPSAYRQPWSWLGILATECLGLALLGMLSLPMGLAILRDQAPVQPGRFVWITATATTVMFSSWHLYRWRRTHTLQMLMHLLDDIDQYNQLVETVAVLNHLSQASDTLPPPDSHSVLKALQASHTSLVTGLQLETLLRRHRRLLHPSQTLKLDLDQALTTLQSLDIQAQAQEYQALINQALWISMSVQTTMQALSSPQARSSYTSGDDNSI